MAGKRTTTPDQAPAVEDESRTEDQVRAAEKRKAAAATLTDDARNAKEIASLIEERRGYVVRGLGDRVAQVDEQIVLRGGTPPTE